ncbi:hypothetical protein KAI92_04630 [Candidatus Parcubacteria bacterium]|nr:hypothetical protein [Candidatus Parcubacteria bacterium]
MNNNELKNKNKKNDLTLENVEELKELLLKNLELNNKIYDISKKVNSYIIFERIISVLKILIFVVPVVLGIMYLPKILEPLIQQYQEILNLNSDLLNNGGNILNLLKK